ncbi:MAG TPA: ATP-binding protein [Candidatus Merdisoma merdipullorum]|nr:ATP-binding protein [Candidatus Merdisoma merdipullorum]
MEVRRDFYLDKLIKRKNNRLIKIITGIRRCGKSYLLNNLFYHHLLESGVDASHILRFAFDSADDLYLIGESLIGIEKEKRGVDPEKFMAYVRTKVVDDGMYYLLLDEIQMLDCFEAVLNSYLRKDNMDVFVTGSNAKLLSKDIATEFAGRGDEVHMYPLSFAEFMSVYEGDKYMGLSEYMLYGGIPLVVLRAGANDKAAALQSLFSEIYIQDIVRRNRVKNIGELEDLLNILSSAIGSLTNPEKLKNTFRTAKKSKITANTIKKYLDYFEDSFLIESAQRYDIKGKAYIETPKKYYFSDLGLRNARINFRQFEQTHSMENVIYNELRMRGYSVDVGVVPVAEKDRNGKVTRKQLEVDFVCNLGSSRYYIQSAYTLPDEAKRTQEVRPFRKIDDSFKKIIITRDMVPTQYDEYGILTINIYDFLLDPKCLEYTIL